MKTTLNLDDELLQRAKRQAAARGTTLTAFVEEALRSSLSQRRPAGFRLELPTVRGNRQPTVDPADRQVLHDRMADEH